MTTSERITALWRLERSTPRRTLEREPASPWGEYRRLARRCTECGAKEIVKDGRYLCAVHDPDAKAVAA